MRLHALVGCSLLAIAACGLPAIADVPVPIIALRSLQLSNTSQTVRASVTRTGPTLFVQDATGGLRVKQSENAPLLHIGDQVSITGRVQQDRYGMTLLGAAVQLLYASVPAPPLAVTPEMASGGRYADRFVETEGRLVMQRWSGTATQIVLHSGYQVYLADINGRADLQPLKVGSLLRVRGICLMSDATSMDRIPFRILMRSSDDVDVVAGPPFWTHEHQFMLGILLVLLSLGAHLTYLRVERWRFHLLLNDRTRTAHDLHDTLAQSFAGVAFQLQAVKNAITMPSPELRNHVDLAIGMVSHSHEDARRAIAMLKPAEMSGGDLLDEMRHQGLRLTQGGGVEFSVRTHGDAQVLEEKTQGALLRIGHEAITNAVRHGSPHSITLELYFEAERVRLLITDDGCGFRKAEGRERGFGLVGMRTRAAALDGTLSIISAPGAGAIVEVSLALNKSHRLSQKVHAMLAARKGFV